MRLPFLSKSARRPIPADLTIIESMVIPAFVLDHERKVVIWNKATEGLTGIPAAEVIGTSDHWRGFYDHKRPCLADLLYDDGTGDGQNLYVAQTGGGAANDHSKKAENWCTMPVRGVKHYLMIDASAIVDAQGRIVAVVETLRDTTAEQDAKAALVAQKEEQDRVIEAQLAQACEAMGTALAALACGDLAYRIGTPLPGVVDKLRTSFNDAVRELEQVVRRTTATATSVCRGSSEIAASAENLSHRTEQQAANLEETAAALAQIMDTVKRTAEGAAHARTVVAATRNDVAKSGEVVHEAVAAMDRVDHSSKQIGQIVGVIDEIAFQTNLLALNAGVEAARAGEVGRGFAVVAAEVRALAQRSAESAKEIKALMMNSATHVEEGVALVGQAGTALTRIVVQIADIDKVVADFAQSTQDQATGLNEINTAVAQMDQVTQQNASMVQQTTAISQDLLQEAGELEKALGRFQVGQDAAPISPVRVARPAPKPLAKPTMASGLKPMAPARPFSASSAKPAAPSPARFKAAFSGSAAVARKPAPAEDNWEEF